MTEKQSHSQTKEFLHNSSAVAIFATYLNTTRYTSCDRSFGVKAFYTLKFDNSGHETWGENRSENKNAKPGFSERKVVYTWLKFRS